MVTVRRATDADAAGIVELNRVHNGEHVAVEIEATFRNGHMAPSDYAVAVAGDRVVSAVGLLPMELHLDEVVVPVGQPEFIATDPPYRGQGLVRQLLDLVHGWSAERGDLVQVIAGIPYFYRQFGYSYISRPNVEWFVHPETEIPSGERRQVRKATAEDIAGICALQEAASAGATVRLPFLRSLWPVLVDLPHIPVLVATSGDGVEAVARVWGRPGAPVHLHAIAAASREAAGAFVGAVRAQYPGRTVVVGERTGLPLRGVLGAAEPIERKKWLYLRIADAAALLRHLRPVLDARLAVSPLASASGRVAISFYRSGVVLRHAGGRITAVSATGRDGSGTSEPDAHIAPDLLPGLLFGPGDIRQRADDPDVDLGTHGDLLAALFPPLRGDVLIW